MQKRSLLISLSIFTISSIVGLAYFIHFIHAEVISLNRIQLNTSISEILDEVVIDMKNKMKLFLIKDSAIKVSKEYSKLFPTGTDSFLLKENHRLEYSFVYSNGHSIKNNHAYKVLQEANIETSNYIKRIHFSLIDSSTIKYMDLSNNYKNSGIDSWAYKLTSSFLDNIVSIYDTNMVKSLLRDINKIGLFLPKSYMDSLLSSKFVAKGIDTHYQYVLTSTKNGIEKIEYGNLPMDNNQVFKSDFRHNIPLSYSDKFFTIHIGTPDDAFSNFKPVSNLINTTIIVIFMILIASIISIRIMFRQKKMSIITDDFIGNMSHEIKTPITTISLACEMILVLKDSSFSNLLRYVKIIQDQNNKIKSHIEKVLQISTTEKGKFRLKSEELNIHEILQKVVSAFKIIIDKRGGNIKLDMKSINPIIEGDKDHIESIVANLIDNANKYSPSIPTIKVTSTNILDGVIISVVDNGIGIAKNQQSKIYDKFYRVENCKKKNVHDVKGFGMGLSYVKKIVEYHNGYIELQSDKEERIYI